MSLPDFRRHFSASWPGFVLHPAAETQVWTAELPENIIVNLVLFLYSFKTEMSVECSHFLASQALTSPEAQVLVCSFEAILISVL